MKVKELHEELGKMIEEDPGRGNLDVYICSEHRYGMYNFHLTQGREIKRFDKHYAIIVTESDRRV